MECKHDLYLLVGVADGIYCRGCGKVFTSLQEVHPEEKPEKKKVVRKRARKVDA